MNVRATYSLFHWFLIFRPLRLGQGNIPRTEEINFQNWIKLGQTIIPRFQGYQVPLIKLFKPTPKEAVCQVFEKVNTGGVSLTVFELLTATYAADNYNLRNDWAKRDKELRNERVLRTAKSDDFLQAISLLASRKRRIASA